MKRRLKTLNPLCALTVSTRNRRRGIWHVPAKTVPGLGGRFCRRPADTSVRMHLHAWSHRVATLRHGRKVLSCLAELEDALGAAGPDAAAHAVGQAIDAGEAADRVADRMGVIRPVEHAVRAEHADGQSERIV